MALGKILSHKTLLKSFQALTVTQNSFARQISTCPVSQFQASTVMLGMPNKKRNKMDPALLKIKQDKRRRKIEKALRKMEKKSRMPIPLVELEISQSLKKEIQDRQRKVSLISSLKVQSLSEANSEFL